MFKKVFFMALVLCLVFIFSSGALAAPRTINPGYRGNAKIINVTNPDDGVTTFKRYVIVSVTSNEGVIITLYLYDPDIDKYVIYTSKDGKNSWRVGPSGLFVKRIPIMNGVNYIGILAELNEYEQFVTRRVDKADLSICDEIKSILIKSIDDIIQ